MTGANPAQVRATCASLLRQAADEIAASPAELWAKDRRPLSDEGRQQAQAVYILAALTVSVSHLANSLDAPTERAARLYRELALMDLRSPALRHLIDCTGAKEQKR